MFGNWTSFMSDSCDITNGVSPNQSDLVKASPRKVVQETPQSRADAIDAIRQLITTRPDIAFERTDDEFLLRFLRARKFDVEQSFSLFVHYYEYRNKHPSLFTCFHPSEPGIRDALLDGFPGVLPEPDQNNRRIVVLFTQNWDLTRYSLISVYRAILLTLETLLDEVETQVNGLVMIIDWKEFSLKQSSQLSPRLLRLIVEGLQDSFPARFAGIHFLNQPWYVEATINLLRSFLKEKTRDKIYVHGNNMASLHLHINREILPSDFGGFGPPYEKQQWAKELLGVHFEKDSSEKTLQTRSVTQRSETCPTKLVTINGNPGTNKLTEVHFRAEEEEEEEENKS